MFFSPLFQDQGDETPDYHGQCLYEVKRFHCHSKFSSTQVELPETVKVEKSTVKMVTAEWATFHDSPSLVKRQKFDV